MCWHFENATEDQITLNERYINVTFVHDFERTFRTLAEILRTFLVSLVLQIIGNLIWGTENTKYFNLGYFWYKTVFNLVFKKLQITGRKTKQNTCICVCFLCVSETLHYECNYYYNFFCQPCILLWFHVCFPQHCLCLGLCCAVVPSM